MKSPKDYVEEYQLDDTLFDSHERPIYFQGFIAEIQKDAYNQAIEDVLNEHDQHKKDNFHFRNKILKLKIK